MDPISTGIIATSSLLGAGANLIGGLSSSKKQYKLAKQQLAWQQEAQKTVWEREDNAVQRRAADLEAAGMNRLLAAGSGAASSAPIHPDVPQAPDYSHIGDPLLVAAQTKMSLAKQRADISQTEAQTRLVEGQLQTVETNNQLLQQTLDWYRSHPDSAPNVPGASGPNAFSIASDLLNRTAGRLGGYIGRRISDAQTSSMKSSRSYDRLYSNAYNFHKSNGLSDSEASLRATNFARSQTSN